MEYRLVMVIELGKPAINECTIITNGDESKSVTELKKCQLYFLDNIFLDRVESENWNLKLICFSPGKTVSKFKN
jgi:hypothetical protein